MNLNDHLCDPLLVAIQSLYGSSAAFTPTSLPGLQLWFDASDSTTLFDATSGGSAVAANGSVARWQDKSSNNWHITQATAGNRPVRKTALIKGLDCVQFGGDDYLFNSTALLSLIARTVFIVFRETTSKDYAGIFVAVPNPANNDYDNVTGYELDTGTAGQQFAAAGSTGSSYSMSVGSTNPAPLAVYCERKRAGSGTLWINNGISATDSSFTEFNATSYGGVAVGARYLTAWAPAYGIIGDVCEVIYYNRELTVSETLAVYTYLAAKWLP